MPLINICTIYSMNLTKVSCKINFYFFITHISPFVIKNGLYLRGELTVSPELKLKIIRADDIWVKS